MRVGGRLWCLGGDADLSEVEGCIQYADAGERSAEKEEEEEESLRAGRMGLLGKWFQQERRQPGAGLRK